MTTKGETTASATNGTRKRGAVTVYQALREEILTLKREPGSALDETAIAKSFDLSRTPVREAILMLSGERLVKVLPNRSCIVEPLTMHQLREMLDTWLILGRALSQHLSLAEIAVDTPVMHDRAEAFTDTIGQSGELNTALALLQLQRSYADLAKNFFLARYYLQCLDAGRRTMLLLYFPYASAADLHRQADLHRELFAAIDAKDTAACNRIVGDQIADILRIIQNSLVPVAADAVDLSTAALNLGDPITT
ncbi:GntR family transcriptional regulator [Aliiroseovarius sp. N1F302]|uniref:GntR family transcriptional regulator n=1 Tax=Aliiroseovarius sediminis TaxID=2925839 RepID=UPI001F5ADC68|nr:GntR family transcriptional regulator [Aliiroseovarius sediminis]MCI2396002.1 GntR family transcriptional regulator [Aliiroseovarius sediminis]